jgi:hypothetical protein
LRELGNEEQALVNRYLERQTNPELRPPGSRLVSYLHLAFPADAHESGGGDSGRRD